MSRNIGYIMRNGAGNRSQHQLYLQSERLGKAVPTFYFFLYASYPQISTPIIRISIEIKKGSSTSFALKDTIKPL